VGHLILAAYGLLWNYIDRVHRIRVGSLNRQIIRLDKLWLRIRNRGKDSRIISVREISVRFLGMNGLHVRLKLGGQEVWVTAWRAGMDTIRLFRCYRRIVMIETLRIADRGARARNTRGFSSCGVKC